MARNLGNMDRTLRVILGLVALGVVVAGVTAGAWSWILGVVGAVLVVTGAVRVCPLYAAFGIRTDRTPKAKT